MESKEAAEENSLKGPAVSCGPIDSAMESQDEEEMDIDQETNAAAGLTETGDANCSGGSSVAGPGHTQNPLQNSLDSWLECIQEWYPERHQKAYFLPPLHFRRTQHEVRTLADQTVLIPRPPCKRFESLPMHHYPSPVVKRLRPLALQSSVYTLPQGEPAPLVKYDTANAIDDDTTEHVLCSLQAFCEERCEVMMVISQLDFRKYLDNETNPISAARNQSASARLPRPAQLGKGYRDGDFDVLMIHRHHGLVVGEVKGVGTNKENFPNFKDHLAKKVQKGMEQLNKAESVLQHLVSDVAPIGIFKTLLLPNITSHELMQALSIPEVKQNVQKCLGTKDLTEAASRCLCGDQMPTMWDLHARVNSDSTAQSQPASKAPGSLNRSLAEMSTWWKHLTSHSAATAVHMSDTVYDQLLARFCGPATTVEVPTVTVPRRAQKKQTKLNPATKVIKTRGQAVAETGLIMSLLTLYPEQVRLLDDNSLQVIHLYGPPGTGKTVILVLKACQWLKQGKPVQVVSLSDESRCVSYLIQRQLEHCHGSSLGIHPHVIKSPYKSSDIDKLASAATAGELFVIADEVIPVKGRSENPSSHEHTKLESFIVKLKKKVPTLHLWCASIRKLVNSPPDWMIQEELTTPLRSPPVVTREVSKSVGLTSTKTIPPYRARPVPAATDGPAIKWLKHSKEPGHSNGQPMNCRACGEAIVELLGELGVGKNGKDPDSLQCKDVFVLCPNPRDLTGDKEGIVSVLRAGGAKVKVLRREEKGKDFGDALKEYREVALAEQNEIIVTDYMTVSGLERRIVIGMGMQMQREEMANRLLAMSRCTAQLVWIGNTTKF